MFSSPMLIVVVLAMVFTLFPLGIALVRLAVPLALLALVPLLARQTSPAAEVPSLLPVAGGWLRPTAGTLKQYFKNLARLVAATIPLMLLGALVGSFVAPFISASC